MSGHSARCARDIIGEWAQYPPRSRPPGKVVAYWLGISESTLWRRARRMARVTHYEVTEAAREYARNKWGVVL